MRTFVLVVLVFAALLVVGCGADAPKNLPPSSVTPTDYGQGVYYFSSTTGFGSELSAFLAGHPTLQVVAVSGLDVGLGYGNTVGYWVVTEPRN